jgi:hypothetical protein
MYLTGSADTMKILSRLSSEDSVAWLTFRLQVGDIYSKKHGQKPV